MRSNNTTLCPLPATARSKTLPMSGRGDKFELVKRVLTLIGEHAHLPTLAATMVTERTNPNMDDAEHCLRAMRTGLRVIEIHDTSVRVTASGRALRQTGDPDSLRERMLTGLLGFDHLLVWMAAAPRPKRWLLDELRQVNAGWTTNAFPNALVNWARWLGLAAETSLGFTLTERGKRWHSMIHWKPEELR